MLPFGVRAGLWNGVSLRSGPGAVDCAGARAMVQKGTKLVPAQLHSASRLEQKLRGIQPSMVPPRDTVRWPLKLPAFPFPVIAGHFP